MGNMESVDHSTPREYVQPPIFYTGSSMERRYGNMQKSSYIADNFSSLEQVISALRESGLESSNLILGIDFTKSNEWTGKYSFNRRSLHAIGDKPNPYEQAISIIGRTLSPFDEDNLIPCYGFGDASTHDQYVFSFYPDQRCCHGFEEALARYREIVPHLKLSDIEVKKGLYDCIERMVSDKRERHLIDRQLDIFSAAEGGFGREIARDTRKTKQPALWWESYGYECPELQKFAIRVLSLTCSATGCERSWSVFYQIHCKRHNRLEQNRLNALVFVKYNLQLEQRQLARQNKDNLDPICLSDMDSDDEWITEQEDPSLPIEDNQWMKVNECFATKDLEVTVRHPTRKRHGPRNTQYDKGKGKTVLVDEEYGYFSDSPLVDEEEKGTEEGDVEEDED